MDYSQEFPDLDAQFERQRELEISSDLGVDLFGDVERYRPARTQAYTEIFDDAHQLSQGERQLIGAEIDKLAEKEYDRRGMRFANKLLEESRRFVNCQHDHIIKQCENDGLRYFIKTFCRSRICEDCGRIYRNSLEKKLLPLLKEIQASKKRGYYLSLLTLTVTTKRFDGYPTPDDLGRFQKESSLFLRRFYGKYNAVIRDNKIVEPAPRYVYKIINGKKTRVRERIPAVRTGRTGQDVFDYRIYRGAGYIAVMELGADNNNLHLHAITYGPYIPQATLSKVWEEITADSYMVDIRQAHGSLRDIAAYVLKYITKPPVSDSYAAIAQFTQLIKGSRRIRTGGIFYNVLNVVREKKEAPLCPYCRGRLLFVRNDTDTAGAFDLYAVHRELDKNGRLPDPLQLRLSRAEDCPF